MCVWVGVCVMTDGEGGEAHTVVHTVVAVRSTLDSHSTRSAREVLVGARMGRGYSKCVYGRRLGGRSEKRKATNTLPTACDCPLPGE